MSSGRASSRTSSAISSALRCSCAASTASAASGSSTGRMTGATSRGQERQLEQGVFERVDRVVLRRELPRRAPRSPPSARAADRVATTIWSARCSHALARFEARCTNSTPSSSVRRMTALRKRLAVSTTRLPCSDVASRIWFWAAWRWLRSSTLELVSDQAVRLALEEAVRSCLQGEPEDAHGRLRTQHFAERCAVRRWHLHGLLDRGEDEALAAEFEERSMPAFRVRRPSQQRDRGLLADQRHQSFAGPVPVDEEHEPRTQMREVGRELVSVGGFEPARGHVVRSQSDVAVATLGLRPVDAEPIEHAPGRTPAEEDGRRCR